MSRTLKPEDRIAHYRIVGPLGAGGMGEVYRAQDQSLERDVALKVLPPDLVMSDERVRRFVLEAKSASSLNHPHIITIYEIGHDVVRGADSGTEPDSSPLHYIAMELVSGKTLSTRIHQEKADLKSLLGWLAQAAEGLAKAHSAGIVHRDLKPSNIMITDDGYAKVLDFGLAKLTERQSTGPDVTSAPTVTGEATSEGTVLGTVNYMSPEQVQGKPVDPRSDIFSFGAILYEAATRRRPFVAESSVETMHRILHEPPTPIEQANPEAPAELRRLIRRCLAKDPNQRLDSMKTLALELSEIVEDYDTLSASASSGSGSAPVQTVPGRRSQSPALIGIGILLVAVLVWIGWLVSKRPGSGTARTGTWKQISFLGSTSSPDVSPDGKSVAYVTDRPDGIPRVMTQDVNGGQPIQVFLGMRSAYLAVRWSGDGSQVLVSGTSADSTRGIWLVPWTGGQARSLPFVGSGVPHGRLSPDGTFLAQVHPAWKRILITELSSGDTTSIALRPSFTWFRDACWSPDGRRLLFEVTEEGHYSVWTARRDGSHQHMVYDQSQAVAARWAPTGDAIYCIRVSGEGEELVKIYLDRDAQAARKTVRVLASGPGLAAGPFGVSHDGRRLACVRGMEISNLWVWDPPRDKPGSGAKPRQMTNETAFVSNPELSPDGQNVAYLLARGGEANIHVLSVADGSTRQITFSGAEDVAWSPDGKQLAFTARERDSLRVWRIPMSGGTAIPLKRTAAGTNGLAWSPRLQLLLGELGNRNFHVFDPEAQTDRLLVSNDSLGWMFDPKWSPDGRHVAVWWNRPDAHGLWVLSTHDTAQKWLATFNGPRRWTEDGSAVLLLRDQSVQRIAWPSGDTTTVLRIPSTLGIWSADFDPSLRRIVYTSGTRTSDVWTLENFDPEVK